MNSKTPVGAVCNRTGLECLINSNAKAPLTSACIPIYRGADLGGCLWRLISQSVQVHWNRLSNSKIYQ